MQGVNKILLEEIKKVNLNHFSDKYPFNQLIHTTKEELHRLIETGHLHYVWLPACPRANRVTSVFRWYGLNEKVEEHQLSPYYKLGDNWVFDSADETFEATSIQDYFPQGVKATQPFLYDQAEQRVISNNSYHMSTLMAELMDEIKQVDSSRSLYPKEHREILQKWNAWIYENVNLKIYQVAAKTGEEKEAGVKELETTYRQLNSYLTENNYLYADQLTESDLRLFNNLLRHQLYYKQFRVFSKPLTEFNQLEQYVERILLEHSELREDLYFEKIRATHFRSDHNIQKYGYFEELPPINKLFPYLEG